MREREGEESEGGRGKKLRGKKGKKEYWFRGEEIRGSARSSQI